MILDALAEADRYVAMGPDFAEAFRFLRRPDLHGLPDGRMDVCGDRLYAIVMRTIGAGREKARLETHRRYLDIQYVVAGTDVMGWRSARDAHAPLAGTQRVHKVVVKIRIG
jgi:biofilm protein TabA